jgi:hypothetical protein
MGPVGNQHADLTLAAELGAVEDVAQRGAANAPLTVQQDWPPRLVGRPQLWQDHGALEGWPATSTKACHLHAD